jgi:16S rRNA (guanine(1405)-N(7))-methyltransferase
MSRPKVISELVDKIANSRSYRKTGIPRRTIEDVLNREFSRFAKESEALSSVKAILHNIMAPYLGDPDYTAETIKLAGINSGQDRASVKAYCLEILTRHDSTRERIPYISDFYRTIIEIGQTPRIIMDLACGLNPFALPFMGLPKDVEYHAYDIHQPRVDLINSFFCAQHIQPLAETVDVLLDPPNVIADAAFLFKEAHRMEKRRKGCSRELVEAINAKVTFISLPNRSLDGHRDLHQRMDALFKQISTGLAGEFGFRAFPGETLYWIRKNNG